MGRVYTLTQESVDGVLTGNTVISTDGKSITVNATIDKLAQGWYDWLVRGWMIQNAFSFLNPDEREFLMTSMTPTEWDELFKAREE